MTNQQRMNIVRQMLEALEKLPAGKKTSTAKLLGKVKLADEEFGFDAEDMSIFHDALMIQMKRKGLTPNWKSDGYGMEYLAEFTVQKQ